MQLGLDVAPLSGVADSGRLAEDLAALFEVPYLLQAVGKHAWDNARRSPIDNNDVQIGLAEARREVDDGLYRSRWERATPAQRDLLRTLAAIGGQDPASVADVARRMGKPRTFDLSVARIELIKKGLVYAPERGVLAFPVPGMHEFINRQPRHRQQRS